MSGGPKEAWEHVSFTRISKFCQGILPPASRTKEGLGTCSHTRRTKKDLWTHSPTTRTRGQIPLPVEPSRAWGQTPSPRGPCLVWGHILSSGGPSRVWVHSPPQGGPIRFWRHFPALGGLSKAWGYFSPDMSQLLPLPIRLEGTSPHQENLSVNDTGTFRCPYPIQTTTRNQCVFIIYEPGYMLGEYGHKYKHVHNKAKKNMEKSKKYKGCRSSIIRKTKWTKKAVKNKAKNFYIRHIRMFLMIRGISTLLAHMSDVGTDGNTAYNHYNNQDLEPTERFDYAYWTVVCMTWSMLAAFIMCIMEVITHNEWSVKKKCLMVALFVVLFPVNSSLILLWDVVAIYISQDPRNRGPIARKAGITKLVEAVSESMPQTVLQLEIVSRFWHRDVPIPTPIAVWLGVATSISSLAFTVATNNVFGGTVAKASRAVWLFGCVVGVPTRVAVMIMGGGLPVWRFIALIYYFMVIMRQVRRSRLKWPPLLPLCDEKAITNVHIGATVNYKWFLLALIWLFVPVCFILYGRLAYNALALFLVVTSIALALTYCTMATMRHVCGDKLKWTPWPSWPPQRDEKAAFNRAVDEYVWYKGGHPAAICFLSLLSVSLCTFDSCCSISSLPISIVFWLMAMWQYPFAYWHLPQPMAMTILVLASVSFLMNLLLTVIPEFRGPGEDWDNAWDITMDHFTIWLKYHRSDTIIWFKQHISCQATQCNSNDDNHNGIIMMT